MKGIKRKGKCYLGVGVVSLLTALIFNPGITSKGYSNVSSSATAPRGTSVHFEENKVNQLEDNNISKNLDISIRDILNNGTIRFFQNYPVDENFLCWFTVNYGEDSLGKVAKYLKDTKKKNPNLWYKLTGRSIHVLWLEYCDSMKFQTYRLDNVKWMEDKNQDGVTTLDFIGDINFDNKWHTMKVVRKSYGKVDEFISESLQQRLKNADITMVNNEFTYGTDGKSIEGKDYCFRASEESISNLAVFGTDIVSLANNHVYDYGKKGLISTLNTLEENNVTYIGAGRNLDEAKRIQYYVVNGKKIAYVAATQIEKYSNFTKAATKKSAGVLKMLNPTEFISEIEEADRNSDYVIAYVHWGSEGILWPDYDVVELAKRFKNAGADVIIGGHSHRLQGVEYIGKTPVFFSLGNFWFSTGALYTAVAEISIDIDGKINSSIVPCVQKNMRTSEIISEEEKASFYEYIADISKEIAIDREGRIYSCKNDDDKYVYYAGKNYSKHYGGIDLEGKLIDVVGNLK